MTFKVEDIAKLVNGQIIGDKNKYVSDVCSIEKAQSHHLSFIYDEKYMTFLKTTQASIVLLSESLYKNQTTEATLILVPNARLAISELLNGVAQILNPRRQGIESPSFISENVTIPNSAYVGAFSYIGKNVQIGEKVQIYPQCYIGDNVKIGENTILYPGVKIYYNCIIGKDCIIHASSVIGSDGFGFEPDENRTPRKIPQIGNVIIEDDIEIGANSTIGRAMMGSTRIKSHSKISDNVLVAHSVQIGEGSILCGQTGIGGSSTIGDHCTLAGQVGVADHVSIPSDCIFGAQSGINTSIRKSGIYMGSPAINADIWRRSAVGFKQLPDIIKKINETL